MSKIIFDRKYRGKAILYIILKFANAGLLLLPPYCYMVFLDEVIMKQHLNRLPFVLGAYVAIFLAKTAVSVWNKQVYNQIFPEITMDYKMKVLKKYSELDIPAISKYTPESYRRVYIRIRKMYQNIV